MKQWIPLAGLMLAAFIFNTSEFIPIGLLSDIAADFGISESHAGMMITIYAWVVAIASLPLMLVFARTESKKLMLSIVAMFVASHVLSGVSTSFNMLMLSRIGVACSHAIFWSIVTPLAVRMAPEGRSATALSLIVSGSSFAMIVGLPLGRTVGLYVGWRTTFLIIAAAAALIFCVLALTLRRNPGASNFTLRKLPALLKSPSLKWIYLLTVITITGHFTGYSYIEPFLAQVAGIGGNGITMVLTLFGVVGIACSFVFSRCYDRRPSVFLMYAVGGISACLLLLQAAAVSVWTSVLLCVFWGFAVSCFNLSFQSEVIRCAPQGTEVAMSIYSGIYNVGIGAGALVGGSVCDGAGIRSIGYVGGAIALAAVVLMINSQRRSRKMSVI